MLRFSLLSAALACCSLFSAPPIITWDTARAYGTSAAKQPAEVRNGVVVTVSAPGSEAGLGVLKQGGNAVDAAVATAFALAVTYPAAGNIGGGGFMVVHPANDDPVVFEYRETAPAASSPTMFKKSDDGYGHRAAGVPGTVRGMELAHKKFGKLPWKTLLAPAIHLAKEGFIIDGALAKSLNEILKAGARFQELQRVFGHPEGGPWKAGDRLVQPELARTLSLIADQGPDVFYKGAIADLIVAEMKSGGGLITADDLAAYRAMQRRPIHGTYRGFDIYAPPPPSSGGICLVEMLNMLEPFDLKKHDRFSPRTLHLMMEAMRRAYADRARHLGDPAFAKIPTFLTARDYAQKLAQSIDPAKASKSADIASDIPIAGEGDSTTHFSVIDKDGLAVSNTYTLERSYGCRVVVKGGGFLLNNEMVDFNWFPGVTDHKGLIGTAANQIAPGKRMLSSQTPTIVAKNGKVLLVTGSPGGRTIINTVLNVVLNVLEYDMPIQQAVAAPRLHHQWFPDEARFEGMKEHAQAVEALRAMGHLVLPHKQGDAHSIWVNPSTGGFVGAADQRISGKVAAY